MSFICVASFLVAFRLILIIHAPHSQAQATGIPIPWIYPEQRPGWLYRCAAPPTHTCPHVHVWRRGAVPDIHGLRGHLQKINMVKLHPQTRSHKEVSIFILDSMLDCIMSSHLVVHILSLYLILHFCLRWQLITLISFVSVLPLDSLQATRIKYCSHSR